MNKMVEGKKTKKILKEKIEKVECRDRFCPTHGKDKLKLRGRTFEGEVVKKLPGRVSIQFERMVSLPKYERYEKRKTKLHARLPSCLEDSVFVGDRIQIAETRPISKMIHFVVSKLIKSSGGNLK
jgi:small subunit ribosomal protein S17